MNRENKFTISYLISNSKKTFHDLPEQKPVAEQIHITHKKKKKTNKMKSSFFWRLCQLKVGICSSFFSLNISSFVLHYLSAMQHLETAVQCMLHSAYFEPCICLIMFYCSVEVR